MLLSIQVVSVSNGFAHRPAFQVDLAANAAAGVEALFHALSNSCIASAGVFPKPATPEAISSP